MAQIKITQTSNADMNIGVPKYLTKTNNMEQQTSMGENYVNKQDHLTAVEWLATSLPRNLTTIIADEVEQAMQIEKEQRIKDYNAGYLDAKCNHVQDAESYLVEQEYLASKSNI